MNFLLHRHFATQETGEPAVGFGSMLPDLVRLVDRRWRPRPDDGTSAADASAPARAIARGIAHHLEADAWFHRTPVFREGEKRTAAALRTLGDEAPRLGLFGHVTFEMCLDGALLRRDGDVASSITALRDDVARYASEANASLRAATSPSTAGAVIDERLGMLWERLPDLAAGYATGGGVAQRLDGMRRSLGLPRASEAMLDRWSLVLEECIASAGARLDALEAERRGSLAAAASAASATIV